MRTQESRNHVASDCDTPYNHLHYKAPKLLQTGKLAQYAINLGKTYKHSNPSRFSLAQQLSYFGMLDTFLLNV